MKRFIMCLLALSFAAGCGIKGGLDRPDPLWGGEAAAAREQARQEAERAEAERRRRAREQSQPAQPAPQPPQ